jgi:hypothetical protein
MTLTRKIAVGVTVLLLGLGGACGLYLYAFSSSVTDLLKEQGVRNEAVKPLLDAVVTKKLKIGDSLDQAKKVLGDAGLDFTVDRPPLPRRVLHSIYRAGPYSGFTIQLELDGEDRITKIEIREYFTGP